MATTTVELGQLLERTNFELFDFDYQFDDPIMKKELEQHVIDFYWFYEIGQETPDRFKHRFKTRWLRMIKRYNKLYNTTLLSYNPLINSKITEALDLLATSSNTQDNVTTTTDSEKTIGTQTTDGLTTVNQTDVVDQDSTIDNTRTDNLTSTNDKTTTTDSNTKNSDYPQQPIAGGDFLAGESVTKSTVGTDSTTTNTGTVKDTGTSTNDTTATRNGTTATDDTVTIDNTVTKNNTVDALLKANGTENRSYTKTIEGLTGMTYQELIQKERDLIISIPNMVIEELKPCFILVD